MEKYNTAFYFCQYLSVSRFSTNIAFKFKVTRFDMGHSDWIYSKIGCMIIYPTKKKGTQLHFPIFWNCGGGGVRVLRLTNS